MEDPIIMHFSDLLNNISALSVDLCTFMQGVQKKQEEIRVVSVQLAEKEKQIEIASVQLAEKEKQIQKLQKELQNSKVMPHVNY
jgi:chromosome segregation ATPase